MIVVVVMVVMVVVIIMVFTVSMIIVIIMVVIIVVIITMAIMVIFWESKIVGPIIAMKFFSLTRMVRKDMNIRGRGPRQRGTEFVDEDRLKVKGRFITRHGVCRVDGRAVSG